MERWALVSGLQGDLDLYEQIQRELKQQRGVALSLIHISEPTRPY